MAKIPEVNEYTRGIRVPDATIRPSDYGEGLVARGVAQLGQGVSSLGVTLSRQMAQAELMEAGTAFDRRLVDIEREASSMDAVQAVSYADGAVKAAAESISDGLKTGIAKRAFASHAASRQTAFYSAFTKRVTAVEQDRLRSRTKAMYAEALESGNVNMASQIEKGAVSTALMSSDDFQQMRDRFDSVNESVMLAGSWNDRAALEEMAPSVRFHKPSITARIESLRYQDQQVTKDAMIAQGAREAARIASDGLAAGPDNFNATASKVRETLIANGFEGEQLEKASAAILHPLNLHFALRDAVKGNLTLQDIAGFYPGLMAEDLARVQLTMERAHEDRLAGDPNMREDQTYAFGVFQRRLTEGLLAPQARDPSAILEELGLDPHTVIPADSELAARVHRRMAAWNTNLSGKGHFDAADRGIITQSHAVSLDGAYLKQSEVSDRRSQALKFVSDAIVHAKTFGDARTIIVDPENKDHAAALDLWYHDKLAEEQSGPGIDGFTKRFEPVQEMVSLLGVAPPQFIKDIKTVMDNGRPDYAIAAAKMITSLAHAGGRLYEPAFARHLDPALIHDAYHIAGLPSHEAVVEFRSRKAENVSTESAWAASRGASEVSQFWRENYAGRGYPPHAADQFEMLVRSHFNRNRGDLSSAIGFARGEFQSTWRRNRWGVPVKHNVYSFAKGVPPESTDHRIVTLLLAQREGLMAMSHDELVLAAATHLRTDILPASFNPAEAREFLRSGTPEAAEEFMLAKESGDGFPTRSPSAAELEYFGRWGREELLHALIYSGAKVGFPQARSDFVRAAPDLSATLDRYLAMAVDPPSDRRRFYSSYGDVMRSFYRFPNGRPRVIVDSLPTAGVDRPAFSIQFFDVSSGVFVPLMDAGDGGLRSRFGFNPLPVPWLGHLSPPSRDEAAHPGPSAF